MSESEHANRSSDMANEIAKLEADVARETARAVKAEERLLNAAAAHGGLGDKLAMETDRANKAEADLLSREREIRESEGEFVEAIAQLEGRLASETERADGATAKLVESADDSSKVQKTLDALLDTVAVLGDKMADGAEKALKHESDLLRRANAQVQTLKKLADADSAIAALRAKLAEETQRADQAARALLDAEAAHAKERLAAQTEGLQRAETDLREKEQQRQILDAISHEADDLRASLEESRVHEEMSTCKIKDLEDKIVEIQRDHEQHTQKIEQELSQLHEFVEQQKEAGNQSCMEAEKSVLEARSLRSALVLARFDYFCKLLLVQRLVPVGASEDAAVPKRAIFAQVLEEQLPDAGAVASSVDINQQSVEEGASQSVSQDTTFGPEGFETLPPLHMSSRKQRCR